MNFIKANYKIILIVVGVFAASFLGGTGIGWLTGGQGLSIVENIKGGKVVNILIMGIDARTLNANSRSDTMILASIDTKNKKVALLWIPRDTRVETSSGGQMKINSVNVLKGPEASCEAVSKIVGTKVDHYVITNFWGFEKIIDTLGGVTIDVETNFRHYDPNPELNINIPKGVQQLNGENALKYVRYRGGPTADIGRTQRQAKFLKALADEVFKSKTILKLPQLVPEMLSSIHTNIPSTDIVYLMNEARDFDSSAIITQTIPGYSFTSPKDGASYWEPDKKVASGIMESLLAGQTYEVIHDPPTWVSQPQVYTEDDADEGPDMSTPTEEKKDGAKTSGQQNGTTQDGSKSGDKTQTGSQTKTDAKQPSNQPSTQDKNQVEPDLPQDVDQDTPPKTTTSGSLTKTTP